MGRTTQSFCKYILDWVLRVGFTSTFECIFWIVGTCQIISQLMKIHSSLKITESYKFLKLYQSMPNKGFSPERVHRSIRTAVQYKPPWGNLFVTWWDLMLIQIFLFNNIYILQYLFPLCLMDHFERAKNGHTLLKKLFYCSVKLILIWIKTFVSVRL